MDLLNNDLSNYLNKKERVVFDVRVNDKICKLNAFIIAFVLMAFVSVAPAFFLEGFVLFITLICWVVFVFSIFFKLVYMLKRSVHYVLTDCGVYKIKGLLFKSVKFVGYDKITDLSISIGPIEQIFKVGSVGIGTASGNVFGSIQNGNGIITSMNELDISGVDEYKEIKEYITKKMK